jgi:hypothetical protein
MKLLNNQTIAGRSDIYYTDGGDFLYNVDFNSGTGVASILRSEDGANYPTSTGNFTHYSNNLIVSGNLQTGVRLGEGFYFINLYNVTSPNVDVELAKITPETKFYSIETDQYGTSGTAASHSNFMSVGYAGYKRFTKV